MTTRLSAINFVILSLAFIPLNGRAEEPDAVESPAVVDWIRPSEDGTHFVREGTGKRIEMWGFNYDHDEGGRLLEDYWDAEWDMIAGDFREMKALDANVVRVHLQFARFMTSPEQPNEANLARLGKLVRLAEETGLYLDLTGLGCYHKQDVPEWYDALEESARWDAQARFWRAVAGVCKESPAIFCYDLMNEPILSGGKGEGWLAGEPLGGKYFVQRITLDEKGRKPQEIAGAWIKRLTSAIREVDPRHMITVGVIPWAYTFKGAKPLFHSPEAGEPLDFVSVHFYPKKDDIQGALDALAVYEVGKPLVVEEIFPLAAGIEGTGAFIDGANDRVDGWISFYWGKTIEENEEAGDLKGAIVAQWLRYFRSRSPYAPKDDPK